MSPPMNMSPPIKQQTIKSSTRDNAKPLRFRTMEFRTPIAPSNAYPYRTVGQIIVELRDGSRLFGAGTLLSDFTVLTAGQLVKGADNEFLDIDKLCFVPAMNDLSNPYGIYDWTYMRAVRSSTRDWALISLAEPAGQSVGYLGARTQMPIESWLGSTGFCRFGLPNQRIDEMWIDEDIEISGVDLGCRWRTGAIQSVGQVGGPLVRNWFSNNPQVVATQIEEPLSGDNHSSSTFMPGWETD